MESLPQRTLREAPEEVASPLLRLHGFELVSAGGNNKDKKRDGVGGNNMVNLAATRTNVKRIQRDDRNLIDLRDITRAVAIVVAMEDLLAHPLLTPFATGEGGEKIHVVENLRRKAKAMASSVRRAAAGLKDKLQKTLLPVHTNAYPPTALSLARFGATIQVHFNLCELADTCWGWGAVSFPLVATVRAVLQLFHPTAVKKLGEGARTKAKQAA